MRVDAHIKGAHQLAALSKRLKAEGEKGKGLRRELLKGIRTATKPMLADTRAAVKAIPITGSRGGGRKAREEHAFELSRAKTEEKRRAKARRGSGLRQTIASAIKLIVKAGSRKPLVRIEVDEKRLPEDQRTLPRHLDSATGWRHPTFGRAPWVGQRGMPWFKVTIMRRLPKVRKEVLRAMNRVAKKIEKGA